MITLDHEPEEGLPRYLARALVRSRRAGEPVHCRYDEVVFVIRPSMTDEEAHAAWVYGRRPLPSS